MKDINNFYKDLTLKINYYNMDRHTQLKYYFNKWKKTKIIFDNISISSHEDSSNSEDTSND